MNNKIKIITPFYNAAEFIERCASTLVTQKYDNYQMIFVDDCSTDNSYDKLPHDDQRAIIIRNEVRKTALENIHDAIMNHCESDDIVVLVDGDDWLPNKNVLKKINDIYNETDCRIMYGQCTFSSNGAKGNSKKYSIEQLNNIRNEQGFHISHIRTFKKSLYEEIGNQDPNFDCLKDSNGEFYKMTYDVAMFYPMIEICPKDKIVYNDESLYVYNIENPISDFRTDGSLQQRIHDEIRKKKTFKEVL